MMIWDSDIITLRWLDFVDLLSWLVKGPMVIQSISIQSSEKE